MEYNISFRHESKTGDDIEYTCETSTPEQAYRAALVELMASESGFHGSCRVYDDNNNKLMFAAVI